MLKFTATLCQIAMCAILNATDLYISGAQGQLATLHLNPETSIFPQESQFLLKAVETLPENHLFGHFGYQRSEEPLVVCSVFTPAPLCAKE